MQPFSERQPVRHRTRKLHEARVVGYTQAGRVKVRYNAIYPRGVAWQLGYFKATSLVADQ